MNQKEYEDMIISERIQMLLSDSMKDMEDDIGQAAEQILSGLDEGHRCMVEKYLDELIMQQAEHEKEIYLGGVRDGAAITRWLLGNK